jgi:diguanylate cyclase (GGDEF)-like protein
MSTEQEDLRLRTLRQYELLDTPREESFDRITRLVTAVLNVPIAAVTLVDRDRQWFKSSQGLRVVETPREHSFCAHTMLGAGPMIVRDATADPRFQLNPLVTGDPDIRFYVGVPLTAPDGTPLGALCGIDTRPREMGPRELEILRELASLTMEQLELRLLATLDGLTGAMRRGAFLAAAGREFELARQSGNGLSCLMIDVDNFKKINDAWGHPVGDKVLTQVVATMRKRLRRSDCLGRVGGEEFCVFLPGALLSDATRIAEQLRVAIEDMRIDAEGTVLPVTASIGATQMASTDTKPEHLMQRADAALYEAKNSGRNQVAA